MPIAEGFQGGTALESTHFRGGYGRIDQYELALTTSPPFVVLRARQIYRLIEFLM